MSGQYLAVRYDKDSMLSAHGAAWVVPVAVHTLPDGRPHLSHDCGSYAELNNVLKAIEADIAQIRRRARDMFELHSAEPTD